MKELIQPKPRPDSDMPWWHEDHTPQADAPAAAVHPQLAAMDDSEMDASVLIKSFMPLPPASQVSAPPEETPAQSWEFIPNNLSVWMGPDTVAEEALTPEPEAEAKPEPEIEAFEDDPAPRRSWLRNLFSFGKRKNRLQAAEPEPPDAGTAPLPSSDDERLFTTRFITPQFVPDPVAPVDGDTASASPALVADLSDLPAQETNAEQSFEESQPRDSNLDRSEPSDDVPVLPSRRGQYRRGKYKI